MKRYFGCDNSTSYERFNIKNVDLYRRRAKLRYWVKKFKLIVAKIRDQDLYIVADPNFKSKTAVAQIMTIDELEELVERLKNDEEQNLRHELFYTLEA